MRLTGSWHHRGCGAQAMRRIRRRGKLASGAAVELHWVEVLEDWLWRHDGDAQEAAHIVCGIARRCELLACAAAVERWVGAVRVQLAG